MFVSPGNRYKHGTMLTLFPVDQVAANPVDGLTVPLGQPGSGKSFSEVSEKVISGQKAVRELGLTYRAPKDTIHDAIAQSVELGWKLE